MTLREEVGPKQREEAPRASRLYKSYRERVQERCLLDSLLPMSRIFTRRDHPMLGAKRADWVVFLANHARRGPVFSAPGQLACASMASLVQGGFDEYMVDYGHGPESDDGADSFHTVGGAEPAVENGLVTAAARAPGEGCDLKAHPLAASLCSGDQLVSAGPSDPAGAVGTPMHGGKKRGKTHRTGKKKVSGLFTFVEAVAAAYGWRPFVDEIRLGQWGASRDDRKKFLAQMNDDERTDVMLHDVRRCTAVPHINGAVLVSRVGTKEDMLSAAVSVSPFSQFPAHGGALAAAINAMRDRARRDSRSGAMLDGRVKWVRAMINLSKADRDDFLRGGSRFQGGYAQGVCPAACQP